MSLIFRVGLAWVAVGVLWSASARADLIGITLDPAPDIFSAFIDVEYDATTEVFVANGSSLTFNDGTGSQAITGGSFNITALILAGGTPISGSLYIDGDVGIYNSAILPLLTGTLSDFGFLDPPGGDLFDFTFIVTGGELAAPYFGGIGATIGVVLDVNDGMDFDGTFTTDFNNLVDNLAGTGQGVADTGVIPAPSALGLIAMSMFAPRRRRRV